MSERGSFTTQYIYCDTCFDACEAVLCYIEKYLHGVVCACWSDEFGTEPIISGRFGGFGPGDELIRMQYDLIKEIQKKMCGKCVIRIVAITEAAGTAVFDFDRDTCESVVIPGMSRKQLNDEDWEPEPYERT